VYRVFVFEQNPCRIGPALATALNTFGCETLYAQSESELIRLIGRCPPECVVIPVDDDSEGEGLRLAGAIRQIDQACPLLLLKRSITAEFAVRALRIGVSDILQIDSSAEEIRSALSGICMRAGVGATFAENGKARHGDVRMVGHGPAISSVRQQIARVAATNANVLITGESGTGKELAAELIHRSSQRGSGPFVSINCAAIPDTLLESELFGFERGAFTGAQTARDGKLQHASGGTVFLDEIGDMSLPSQAKILRALETRTIQRLGSNVSTPVDIRLVAATNQVLEQLVSEKKFRQDLYFRLDVVRIHLPPLRERTEDISELTEHLLSDLASQLRSPVRRIQSDVLEQLKMHDWPGNIRELRNVVESILVFSSSSTIGPSDLPLHIRTRLKTSLQSPKGERSQILSALSSVNWNRGEAAKILRYSRMTLYRRMQKHSITSPAS
jgi:DNA-binding NtrC family response regulator